MSVFRHPGIAISLTSFFGVFFALFLPSTSPVLAVGLLSFVFPLFMIWMTIAILRQQSHTAPSLENGAEWGYTDAPDVRPVEEE